MHRSLFVGSLLGRTGMAAAVMLMGASVASAVVVADFGTLADDATTTVGLDVPGFGFGTGDPMTTPPNEIYGGPVFTADTVQSYDGTFVGTNLPNIPVDSGDDFIVRIRALSDTGGGNARLEIFDTDYSEAVFLSFDTSVLTDEFVELKRGSLAAQSPSGDYDYVLRGLQIVSDGNSRSFEIDFVITRPADPVVPEPTALGVAAAGMLALRRSRR